MSGMLFGLAARSAWNRRGALLLAALSIALGVLLLAVVERVREAARDSYLHAVSGMDLIVAARGSPVEILLSSVFRLGAPASALSWPSATAIAAMPEVAWAVPLVLGDSHRGYPVAGTTREHFERFRAGGGRALGFAAGRPFGDVLEVVIGADVAARLGYAPGRRLVLSHGSGDGPGVEHGDKPFVVTGVLARSGTPADRTLFISLESFEALHLDWRGGAPLPGLKIPAEQVRKFDLTPKSVTAVFVGLKERAQVFDVQRRLQARQDEPLTAVLPAVALDDLWRVMGGAESMLLALSGLVALVALAGLVATVLAGLDQRRREIAILRAVGAGPRDIFALLVIEALAVAAAGTLAGLAAAWGLSATAGGLLADYGVFVAARAPGATDLAIGAAVLGVAALTGLLPGYRAYRLALHDGLTPRV